MSLARVVFVVAVLFVASLLVPAARTCAQAPETRGALTVSVWDAGVLSLDGTAIHVHVYHPESGGPYPLVGVIHGANADGSYHVELATTLASRGFVAVVPDMPCQPWACDHDANQRQISALLTWAVGQSAEPGSRLAGKVDGERRALIGHSWGGLSSHLTAARDPSIDAVVLFDPNDDLSIGVTATSTITAPHLTLRAADLSACDSAWQPARVRDALTSPHMDVVVSHSGHCDPAEVDGLCRVGCGAGEPSTTPTFRRYAIAWTACVLTGDPTMASWIGGADFDADVAADRLTMAHPSGLESLPCRAIASLDAGTASPDDAGASTVDAGSSALDAAGPSDASTSRDDGGSIDAGSRDAGTSLARDAGRGTPDEGCSCRAPGASRPGRGSLAALGLVALALSCASRARRRR